LMNQTMEPDESWWEIEIKDEERYVKVVIQKADEHKEWDFLFKCLKLCRNCGVTAYHMSKCKICLEWFNLTWLGACNFFPLHILCISPYLDHE
jgi:hypothetical protein